MESRRDFLKGVAAATALSAIGTPASAAPGPRFNAIQIAPVGMLDEGFDRCLDLLQSTARINCLMLYTHTYYGDFHKPQELLAQDHGEPTRPMRDRKFPVVWVKHHDRYFANTSVRHKPVDPTAEYANHDIFAELREPLRKRGMKLYARMLEGTDLSATVTNFAKVCGVDAYGKPNKIACWNHPEYRAWWTGTVEDVFRTYDLDGLQWGAERMGPIMNVVMPWNDDPPSCFCTHCEARARAAGVDPARARRGFQELYTYVRALIDGKAKPADGVFTEFLRVLLRYPEILGWEYQYRMAREDMEEAIYQTVKKVKPTAEVGWHIDHQPSSFDLIYRAEMAYSEMAPYSDYLKPILYHDVLGPRMRNWYLARFQKTILGELSLQQSLELYYGLFDLDKTKEPSLDQLNTTGFSPDYVYRETKRSKASAAGKIKIYPGIGFDAPWNNATFPGNPETIYQCVLKAFEAGADGIVVSRDYEEMRVPNLKAVGRAMKELGG